MKLCSKCGKWKLLEDFHRDASKKDGLCFQCKACTRAYSKKWYAANKKRAKASARKRTRTKKGRRTRVRVTQRRRARLARTKYDVTDYDMRVLLQQHEVCPYCGGTFEDGGGLVYDHVVPLSRGGSNAVANILPACRRCNSEKGAKLLDEWTDRWYEKQ